MKIAGVYINMEAYREDRSMGPVSGAILPEVGPGLAAMAAADNSGVLTAGKGNRKT